MTWVDAFMIFISSFTGSYCGLVIYHMLKRWFDRLVDMRAQSLSNTNTY